MARPALPQETVRKVEEEWGCDTARTAKDVHIAVHRKWSVDVSLRKVQQIVRELKDQGAGGFEPSEWFAWENPEESPEDTYFLLGLSVQTQVKLHRKLYQHEAKWARRLRPVLHHTPFVLQMEIIGFYAQRESVSINLRREPFTADLDNLIAFRPWASVRHWRRYVAAIDKNDSLAPGILHIIESEPYRPVYVFGEDGLLIKLAFAILQPPTPDHLLDRGTLQISVHPFPETGSLVMLTEQLRQKFLNILFPDANTEEDRHEGQH